MARTTQSTARPSARKNTSAKPGKRYGVGYVRVSRTMGREGESFIAPEVQRERILGAAQAMGVEIVEWIEDLDQSGKKWDRPGFQRALSMIEDPESRVSVMVVARMSRFARSVLDGEKAIKQIEAANGALIAADLNLDTSTPNGRMMRGLFALIAQWELEVISESWDAAKSKAIGRGVCMKTHAPRGYVFDDGRRLVPDPERAALISELFDRRAAGAAWSTISTWWHEQTGEQVVATQLARIVKNRVYLGESRHGDLCNEDAHPAIVTVEQFDAANHVNVARPSRSKLNRPSLLAGIVHCGTCGKPMTASTSTTNADRYVCAGETNDGRCEGRAVVAQHLADEWVEAQFLAHAHVEVQGESNHAHEMNAAIDEMERARTELLTFVEMTSASQRPEMFSAGLAQRETAFDVAEANVLRLRQSNRVGSMLVDVTKDWPNIERAERRNILKAAIERVEVHRASGRRLPFAERATLVWRHQG